MRRTPALIVGGGPAGAAAAIVLARANASHLLVERTRETGDALCGGFLSWRTLETLGGLGIDPETLNPAMLTRVRLYTSTQRAEARLPRPARAVSRHRLDTVMLAAADAAGGRIERGAAVRTISGATAQVDGATISANALFLATGKHDVRGTARPAEAAGDDPTLGLRVRLSANPALARLVDDAVELHLFAGGYAGIALQEDGSANVCLAVRRSRLRRSSTPLDLLRDLAAENPALGDRMAFMASLPVVDAVANVPYGWRARNGSDGTYRLGDQAGVIPSLAGEGMGIAFASGVSAARAYLRGIGGELWQPSFARTLGRPIGIADLVRHTLERPAAARALLPLTRMIPGLIHIVASATRIAHQHP